MMAAVRKLRSLDSDTLEAEMRIPPEVEKLLVEKFSQVPEVKWISVLPIVRVRIGVSSQSVKSKIHDHEAAFNEACPNIHVDVRCCYVLEKYMPEWKLILDR